MSGKSGKPGIAGTGERGPAQRLIEIGAYLLLLLFGLLQGVIGCFQYGRGPVPVASVCFGLGIFATCVLAASGMRSVTGGLMPGVGWFIAAFTLATGTRGGSVLITNTTAGEWFLLGGSACAALGCLVSYLFWAKLAQAARVARRGAR